MRMCYEPSFYNEVIRISENLGTSPENLLAVMSFETGGTFSPSIRNGINGKAIGLIQFMPKTAEALGTSTEQLALLSATQQLSFVERYLEPFKGKIKSLSDLYMAVFSPRHVWAPENESLAAEGSSIYNLNKVLDRNLDGIITKDEASTSVHPHLTKIKNIPLCDSTT